MDQTLDPISPARPTRLAPGVLRSLACAAAFLWLPTLLPLFLGPLSECGDCLRTYLTLLPVVPGVVGLLAVRDSGRYVLAALVTVALLAGLTFALRRLPRGPGLALAILLGCTSGAQALLLGGLLRM